MKRFEIFRPGAHTASGGQALTFSEADLDATVRAYDPAKHEAPIVVGHPKDNHPAYGWVGQLSFAEGALVVEPQQVDPDFAEMVQKGRFKKRSASFYAPDAKTNPVPGVYYLRHVGFLGAQPPAVKGLKDVAFADDDGCVEFEEDWIVDGIVARLFSGLRDFIVATYGMEKADAVLPKYAIQDLERHASDAQPKPSPMFTEDHAMTHEQIAALQAQVADLTKVNTELKAANNKLTTDFAEAQKQKAATEKAALRADIKTRIDGLVKAGKVVPAEVETLTDFAASLDDGEKAFSFGEGSGAEKLTARALYLKQIEARPVAVDFAERAAGSDAGSEAAKSKDLGHRARAYKAAREQDGQTLSYTEAVDAVLAGKDK